MCEFPSWTEMPDGTILFLTDDDIARLSPKAVQDCCGHSALHELFPKNGGTDRKGFPCPPVIAEATRAGKMRKMMMAGDYAAVHVNKDGQLHRDDGPAVEYADGRKDWYRNGKYLHS